MRLFSSKGDLMKSVLGMLAFLFIFAGCTKSKPEFWIYTSFYKETIAELEGPMQKLLPHVQVKWFQGGSETVATKLNAELLAGKPKADLLMTSDPFWYEELKNTGKLEPYRGADSYVPDQFRDPKQNYSTIKLSGVLMGYNSKIVDAGKAPRTWLDLLKPEWKGKIAMGSPLESGTTFTTVALLSKKYGWDFFKKLREQNVLSSGGNSTVMNRIETGERPIGILLLENILVAQAKGSSVRPIYPVDGVVPIISPIAIMKGTAHLKEAQAAYDWFFGGKVQDALVRGGMYSFRPESGTPERALPIAKAFPGAGDIIPWSAQVLQELFTQRNLIKAKFTEMVLR